MKTLYGFLMGIVLLTGCAGQRQTPTVGGKTFPEYCLYRKQLPAQTWDKGVPYPPQDAEMLLKIAARGKRWTGDHAQAVGEKHGLAYAPDNTIRLTRWAGRTQMSAQLVDVHAGNWLVHYKSRLLQVSPEGHEALNRIFPENK
jgi:hypothetical protein